MSRRKKVGRPEGRGDDIAARTLELAGRRHEHYLFQPHGSMLTRLRDLCRL